MIQTSYNIIKQDNDIKNKILDIAKNDRYFYFVGTNYILINYDNAGNDTKLNANLQLMDKIILRSFNVYRRVNMYNNIVSICFYDDVLRKA